ncbi:unnamed protein product [Ceratitis capitata]|uniref:(Mediterranean fruit fly) hypothetical protein n=1 Tax=Ceratitis capitata TaxID=7213 RepID=A0A811V807_CERCA|nr:unnamed protein product [Ceratitis capitata]
MLAENLKSRYRHIEVFALVIWFTFQCSTYGLITYDDLVDNDLNNHQTGEGSSRFPLLMPQVSPNMPELYLCTPVKVDYTTNYYIANAWDVLNVPSIQSSLQQLFEKAYDWDTEDIVPPSELRLQINNNATNIQLIAKLLQEPLEEIASSEIKQ